MLRLWGNLAELEPESSVWIYFPDESSEDPVFAAAIENAGNVVLAIAGSQPSLFPAARSLGNILMPVLL
jgi:hypothetical protein